MASEVKTNKISPATASALSIGDSGDTITIPSGATLDISASTLTPPATLPASSGVNLTDLNATNLGSGTVPTARLGSGTADGTTFLRGDQTYAVAGGTNTPYFYAYLGTDQAPADASWEKVDIDTVSFQTGSTFNTTDSRWTPGVAGKYFIYGQAQCRADSNNKFSQLRTSIYKNGSDNNHTVDINVPENILRYYTSTVSAIIDLDADDYVELFLYFDTYTGTRTIYGSYQATHFMGFKLLD